MNLELILSVIAALGVRELLGKLLDAWHGKRTERREYFESLTQRLEVYVATLEDRIKTLEGQLSDVQPKLARLLALEALYQSIASSIELQCPYDGERCILRQVFRGHVAGMVAVQGDGKGDGHAEFATG